MSGRIGTLAATAALTLGLAATAALAGGAGEVIEVPSSVRLSSKAPAFHGKVTAANPNCVAGRVVKLFKKRANGDRKLLGRGRTQENGKWRVRLDPLKSGVYFAVVKRFEDATAGPIYDCQRAKSNKVFVD